MLLLCYPKCSTCAKAQKWLDENGFRYEYRDIKAQNPTAAELRAWHKASGLPLRRFFNTSGQLYRQMNLAQSLGEMPEAEQYDLLATDGMLVKRPLLVGEGWVLAGFRPNEWKETVK